MPIFRGVNALTRPILRVNRRYISTESSSALAGKLFFPGLCLGTAALGVWQTQRYFEKVELVHKREDDLKLEPLSSFDEWRRLENTNNTDKERQSYRRVYLRGKFQHENEILIGPRGPPSGALAESGPNSGRGGGMSSDAQGFVVLTPFVICDENDESESTKVEVTRKRWLNLLGREKTAEPEAPVCAQQIVWVNRGWIPRHFIDRNDRKIHSWEHPKDTIQVVAMESFTEKPKSFTPPSRLGSKEPSTKKLLWLDRRAIEEITSCKEGHHPPLFVEINTASNETPSRFPVKPTEEFVGEFKVTPAIHFGYGFTWFSLSGAGIVMTRKLLLKR